MTTSALLVASLLALLIGAVLGLVGGGGGILAVPVLVYVAGVGARPAIAMSLVFVGTTSLVGALIHARRGRVKWKLGALFGAASMGAAFVGGRLAHLVPEQVLLGGLAAVMLTTAIAMLRGTADPPADAPRRLAAARVLGIGLVVGLVAGLVGAGGGFLIVPALTIVGGLAMREAIATSLFVIALQSFAGVAGHLGDVSIDGRLIAVMTTAAVIGMAVGSTLAARVSTPSLKRGFAGLVLATGLFVLYRQLTFPWSALLSALALVSALVVARRAARPIHPLDTPERECTTSVRLQP